MHVQAWQYENDEVDGWNCFVDNTEERDVVA